ncbi:zinc finger transcription factor ace1 [Zopfia rhizophila CBS 207.26]|uniref:Zinc finger transcription factor ace1 n=1 Tax=Zopfia rhizophila CBS 207.26 TaxID=1314779 RepID=A0A6A6E506_9PEZI|nr:zinc finger transcription factor ace1 [Zopfia rhizophila CBS 207.26]
MSASHQTHPRRRPLKATHPQVTPLSTHSMQLRKSGTFSSPTNISSDLCDLENHHYMPRRSPTSTENLEDLLHDAGVRRVANILKDFDKKLAGHKSASGASILNDPEVLPLPSFILENTTLDAMDIDPKPPATESSPHDHASDSGLGSSVGSKYDDNSSRRAGGSISTSVTSSHAAITRSFSALGASEEKHTLGEYACKQIHDHIIKPILAEESLKDFHPLINDVPRRIGEKNISNLRDLEKTLIFLAPEFSATPTSYLRFCERSIQLLHATVDCLSEQDQRLPSDRPYTNNYFLDLVEQIRRYAAIMAATRQKEANGEELDEMDYSRDEKITLRGGLSHNGRPAELVREKNGKVIPIADGTEDAYTGFSAKRALSDDEDEDDGAKRSMARRRKSEKPGDVMHVCRDCKKEFKRPCDLTKHEKTHSRPWKCTEEKCKYFELGWPTEKERDRHVNDKHSSAPPQYKCLYPPCTYASKRESNCKQHMEKAHGWEYIRSKSNGRKKANTGSERSPPTPLTPFLGTPRSNLATPMTPFAPSPSVPLMNDFDYSYGFGTPAVSLNGFPDDYRRDSVTTDGSVLTYSSGHSPTEPTSFEDAVTPEDTTINHNDVFNCGLNTNTFDTTTFQQPTPAVSTGFDNLDNLDFSRPFPINTTVNHGLPHLSPGAQPDVTLFSPQMQIDEGFDDGMAHFARPTGDFTLFDSNLGNNVSGNPTADFFPDLSQFGGQFDQLYTEPSMSHTFDDIMGGFENPQ